METKEFKPPMADIERDEENPFVCPYCSKKFNCSQALGGHINAHRQERFEARRERRAIANARRKLLAIAPSPHPTYPNTSRAQSNPAMTANPPLHYLLSTQQAASSANQSRLPPPMNSHPTWNQVQINGDAQCYQDLDLSLRLSQSGEDEVGLRMRPSSPLLGLTLGPGQFDDDLDLTLKL